MTEKSKKYADNLLSEYAKLVTETYECQIPDEVKRCFKNHCDYIATSSSAFLDGHGFNHEIVSMRKQVPTKNGHSAKVSLTAIIADKLIKAKRKYEKAKEDYKALVQETESALSALKTSKNIRENLPEAIPFLPPPMSNSLVVNFNSLQKRLNKQPDVLKEGV